MFRNTVYALSLALATSGLLLGAQAMADAPKKALVKKGMMIAYFGQSFQGDNLEVTKMRTSVDLDFTIGSIAVAEGDAWEICELPRFKGPCQIVNSNQTNLGKMKIGSVRPVKKP
jgi:Beta/Gamma crystallin